MKTVEKISNKDVQFQAPPSKAHTLRAIIIASLAKGQTTIHKPLLAEDQLNVISCLKKLGVKIEHQGDKLIINGLGGNFQPTGEELNVGESGVGMNFLTSAACLSKDPVTITGAKRITERPIGEVVGGLRQLGCKIECLENEGFPPIMIHGGGITGPSAAIHGAKNSQYFSSIVISAPYAKQDITLKCLDDMTEKPYFDITVQMMADFGVKAHNNNYKEIFIPAGQQYSARDYSVEGDYSSASFFFLAAALCQTRITVTNLAIDTKQGDCEFLDLLEKMGAEVIKTPESIIVTGKPLNPIEQDMSDIPDLVPPFAIACAFAEGTSRLTNIGHLRHKECDRLGVVAAELNKMGVSARADETSLTIQGTQNAHGAVIDPHNDHRIAMSFAVAGLLTGGQSIQNPSCVAKSFPDFWEKFEIFSK